MATEFKVGERVATRHSPQALGEVLALLNSGETVVVRITLSGGREDVAVLPAFAVVRVEPPQREIKAGDRVSYRAPPSQAHPSTTPRCWRSTRIGCGSSIPT